MRTKGVMPCLYHHHFRKDRRKMENNDMRELLGRLKSTLGAAGEMAKQGLDMAGKKTGEVLESAKLRWRLSELQSDIRQIYREVGQFVYEARADADADTTQLKEMFEELDEKTTEVENLRQELKARRGEIPCPNPICAGTVHPDDAYCRKCGVRLGEDTP